MYLKDAEGSNQGGTGGNVPYRYNICFNAKRQSSIYVDGLNMVVPSNVIMYWIIKY